MSTGDAPQSGRTDKDWIEHWRRVGPILEEIKRQELRNFKHEEQWEIVDALLQLGLDQAGPPRTTSGLVEWARLMAKAHAKEQTQRPDAGGGER
jgi:hypothetical protein